MTPADPAAAASTRPPGWATAVVLSVVLAASWWTLRAGAVPFEDAAILMRYAEHLAQGRGIVWNVGEAPVDGATDFLFLIATSAVVLLGASVETAARTVAVVSHLATVLLLLHGSPRLHPHHWAFGVPLALYYGLGPGLAYNEAYFGTSLFAALVALTWYFLLRYERDRDTASARGFALAGLAGGLARPEGVLLVGFMLAALGVCCGWRALRPLLAASAAAFGTVGLAYFAWHWWYFQQPLPNPFYTRSDAFPNWRGAALGVQLAARMVLPVLPVFLLAGISERARRLALLVALPALAFLSLWVIVSTAMNYLGRYQYAVVAMLLLSAPGLVKEFAGALPPLAAPLPRAVRRVAVLAAAAVVAGACWHVYRSFGRLIVPADGRAAVGRALAPLAARGYSAVVTEAGLLPLYSRWRTVDALGLNDRAIAREGLDRTDLARLRPDLIMFLADFSPFRPPAAGAGEWFRVRDVLETYATAEGYVLAAAWGRVPDLTHYYYVKADSPDCQAIVEAVRGADYRWFQSGTPAVDYSRGAGARQNCPGSPSAASP